MYVVSFYLNGMCYYVKLMANIYMYFIFLYNKHVQFSVKFDLYKVWTLNIYNQI